MADVGTPLIEPIADEPDYRLVTFVWRDGGITGNVVVVGAATAAWRDWRRHMLARLPNSDVWYKTYRFRSDLRTGYRFSVNDPLDDLDMYPNRNDRLATFRPDPLNRSLHIYPKDDEIPEDQEWRFSMLELPDAPEQPYTAPRGDIPHGTVEMVRLRSEILSNERRVYLYTPPGYTADAEPYGLLLAFDGLAYISDGLVPTPTILDNLIAAGKIPPLVAVLPDSLDNETRSRELPCYEPFLAYLRQELLPWVYERRQVTRDPARAIVAGSSYGGLAAAYVGLNMSDIFGAVLSQSGAYWWGPSMRETGALDPREDAWLIRQFVTSPAYRLRVWMEVGLYERSPGFDMVAVNRHLRDVLGVKGYDVAYSEYNGGHEYICWRGSLADGLVWLTRQDEPGD
jgi:enterochelin esterase family protein